MSNFNYSVPNPNIDKWKADGKKVALTICCHTPEEILHAADILPVRLKATGAKEDSDANLYMTAFSCSFARACLQKLIDGDYDCGDLLVGSNGCLMAQRIYDNEKVIDAETNKFVKYQFTAPRVRSDISKEFYIQECKDLIAKLEEVTGKEVTEEKLKESIALYNETRRLIREIYEFKKADYPVLTGEETLKCILACSSMPKEEFNKVAADFIEELKGRTPDKKDKPRIMVIGSSLDDPDYLKIIEDQGCVIVTDALCYGTRYLWEPVETDKPALEALADNYLFKPTCPRMLDIHDDLAAFVINMAKEYRVDGVINVMVKNCVPWGSEVFFLKEKLENENIPLLTLEREEITTNAAQVSIRVGAFLEMIEED